jgi:hypothetical protein
MTTRVIDFVPLQFKGNGRFLSGGDKDFWGPPDFKARLWLENYNQIIRLRGRMTWEEPKSNWTTFSLDIVRVLFDIRSRLGAGWYFVSFRENYDLDLPMQQIPGSDGNLKPVYESDQGMISSIRASGDSWSFGPGEDEPKLEINFNRVYFTASNDTQASASIDEAVEDVHISGDLE